MKKYELSEKISVAVIIILSLLTPGVILLITRSILPSIICLSAGIVISAFSCALIYSGHRRTDALMKDLSELIESLSSCKKIEPTYTDTLFSKLQSQLLRLNETLTAQKEENIKEKDDIKSLISDISHQLKTPVAALRMYGELLQDETESEDNRQDYLQKFSVSLEKLTFLTDSLIKLSRLESGIIVLNIKQTSVNNIMLSAIKQVFPKAERKNIEIFFDSDKSALTLWLDERWTEEAFFNILDNAVKYTPENGKVIITFNSFELFAKIDISDTGIGIPENELAGIFGRFFRGSNAALSEGAGIGLYLTRKIITQEGGYIKAASSSQGSTFSVFLSMTQKS